MGPPVDVDIHAAFDLTNVNFVTIVLGIILEGRVTLLHIAPPCSSYSMAFNRFPTEEGPQPPVPGRNPGTS